MPKYRVTVHETYAYMTIVEAEDAEAAERWVDENYDPGEAEQSPEHSYMEVAHVELAPLKPPRKFKITLRETVDYEVDVEALTEEEAAEEAREIWAKASNPTADFSSHGYGVEVWESEEIKHESG